MTHPGASDSLFPLMNYGAVYKLNDWLIEMWAQLSYSKLSIRLRVVSPANRNWSQLHINNGRSRLIGFICKLADACQCYNRLKLSINRTATQSVMAAGVCGWTVGGCGRSWQQDDGQILPEMLSYRSCVRVACGRRSMSIHMWSTILNVTSIHLHLPPPHSLCLMFISFSSSSFTNISF